MKKELILVKRKSGRHDLWYNDEKWAHNVGTIEIKTDGSVKIGYFKDCLMKSLEKLTTEDLHKCADYYEVDFKIVNENDKMEENTYEEI